MTATKIDGAGVRTLLRLASHDKTAHFQAIQVNAQSLFICFLKPCPLLWAG